MPTIRQFRYGADNLGYVIHGQRRALIVDGGAAADILRYTESRGLEVSLVGNTHGHADHTSGNTALLKKTGAKYLLPDSLKNGERISLGDETVSIMRTPGHTEDSICFLAGSCLISGDTLFNGTIGNCFTGDLPAFYPHSGFVRIAFTHAFHHLYQATPFYEALAAILTGGGDTDTNACIAGGLLGALHGAEAIPEQMRSAVLNCDLSRGQSRPNWLRPINLSGHVRDLIAPMANDEATSIDETAEEDGDEQFSTTR